MTPISVLCIGYLLSGLSATASQVNSASMRPVDNAINRTLPFQWCIDPFLRELCCVAYRLAASVNVNKSPVKPEKAFSKMAAPCVESS